MPRLIPLLSLLLGSLGLAHALEEATGYEVIDQLQIQVDGETRLSASSNALVALWTIGNDVVIQLRPDIQRAKTKADDPDPGVLFWNCGGETRRKKLSAAEMSFIFEPSEEGAVRVQGLPEATAIDTSGLLSQGPSANILRSLSSADYMLRVLVGRQQRIVTASQQNEALWVDLVFGSIGEASVGKKGWQLPMRFVMPEQEVIQGLILSGEAATTYSSVRVGPEGDTSLTTRIQTGTWAIERQVLLRQVNLLGAQMSEGLPALPAPEASGPACAWSRFATLGLLGVQRLAGVREAGLSIWSAQASIDAGLAAGIAEDPDLATIIADSQNALPNIAPPRLGMVPEREHLAEVEAKEQALSERDELAEKLSEAEQEIFDLRSNVRYQWHLSAAASLMFVDTDGGSSFTGDTKATSLMPFIEGGWDWGERYRLGLYLQGVGISANSDESNQDWLHLGAKIRGGIQREQWFAGASLGMISSSAYISSSGKDVEGDSLSASFGADAEYRFGSKYSVLGRLVYAGGGDGTLLLIEPAFRWYLHPRMSIQLQASVVDSSMDIPNEDSVGLSGFGGGFGLEMRW